RREHLRRARERLDRPDGAAHARPHVPLPRLLLRTGRRAGLDRRLDGVRHAGRDRGSRPRRGRAPGNRERRARARRAHGPERAAHRRLPAADGRRPGDSGSAAIDSALLQLTGRNTLKRLVMAVLLTALVAVPAATAKPASPPTLHSGQLVIGLDPPAVGFQVGTLRGDTVLRPTGYEIDLGK